eukprot:scaffold33742_cov115-Cyclotella_meneghiniana.AAC.2
MGARPGDQVVRRRTLKNREGSGVNFGHQLSPESFIHGEDLRRLLRRTVTKPRARDDPAAERAARESQQTPNTHSQQHYTHNTQHTTQTKPQPRTL